MSELENRSFDKARGTREWEVEDENGNEQGEDKMTEVDHTNCKKLGFWSIKSERIKEKRNQLIEEKEGLWHREEQLTSWEMREEHR